MRVVYSIPQPLGSAGIGTTAWHHVEGLARAGARVTVVCTTVHRRFDPTLNVRTISVLGPVRPRMIGSSRAGGLVDRITARRVRIDRPDIVHTWPGAVLRTASQAAAMGIPSVREAPSPYTRVAVEHAAEAWAQLGLLVPVRHFHHISEERLAMEDAEFRAVDVVLVGSPEAAATFSAASFPVRVEVNRYGFDPNQFGGSSERTEGPTVVFVGRCEPTKGIHLLLRAWHKAQRPEGAQLMLCGFMHPLVKERLVSELDDHSVVLRGHITNVSDVLKTADVAVLPSFSEGSALVSYEALGSATVPLVSVASGSPVVHGSDGLVHETGNADQLLEHLNRMFIDPAELARLRANGIATRDAWTWSAATERLLRKYQQLT